MTMDERYTFLLYVAEGSDLSQRARQNFDALIRPRLRGNVDLTIIDIGADPQAAADMKVAVTPMLIRTNPLPLVRVPGDLSEKDRVLTMLGLTY